MSINPELGVPEIIQIVREATQRKADGAGGFGTYEIVDEESALRLARATLQARAQ